MPHGEMLDVCKSERATMRKKMDSLCERVNHIQNDFMPTTQIDIEKVKASAESIAKAVDHHLEDYERRQEEQREFYKKLMLLAVKLMLGSGALTGGIVYLLKHILH